MNEIFNRQSIRNYTEQKVEPEKITAMLKAAMQAPSAGNQRPWEFLVITDEETRKKVSEVARPFGPAAKAPLLIIPMSNMERAKFSGYVPQDMGACTENLLLEAVTQGLGAVWMGVESSESRVEKLKELFQLPENIRPFAVVAIGYPAESRDYQDRYEEDRIHYEKF